MEFLNLILTSLLSAAALFIIAKIMGHKQMAQLDFFDYINGITIGSIAAELATELEAPWKPLVAMAVYGGLSILLSKITHKLPRSRKFINGSPGILLCDGKLYRQNMKKAKLDLSEFMVMCREQGYFDLRDIRAAFFEYNGKLTILPQSAKRPATPADLKLVPSLDTLCIEIIMDGRIMDENLHRMGLDATWLKQELKARGYGDAKAIYLGLCDEQRQLILFPNA